MKQEEIEKIVLDIRGLMSSSMAAAFRDTANLREIYSGIMQANGVVRTCRLLYKQTGIEEFNELDNYFIGLLERADSAKLLKIDDLIGEANEKYRTQK
jgi:hypothetical protein